MHAAIYERKSTAQSDVADEAKSLAHQEALCRAFIARQGWTVVDAHIYVDEGVSGAIFERPGLRQLLDAAEARPRPFDVVVMYAEDRLGRDVVETGYVAKRLIDNGMRIFFADGTERKLESASDALMMAISNFGAAFERERASARVRDKMFSKAQQGHHTGGHVYGYDAVPVAGHVELRINPAEAAIVRRLFVLSAQGYGIKRLAGELNAEGVPGPKAGRRWSATGIRDMIRNERYRGVLVFGRTQSRLRKGVRKKVPTPESTWVRLERPQLRIVPEALWCQTHARLATTFSADQQRVTGRLTGPPERSVMASKHLLSGMLECGVCYGKLVAIRRRSKSGRSFVSYRCGTHRTSGPAACSNNRGVPAETIHAMVVAAFKRDALTPARVEQAVREELEARAQYPAELAAERHELQQALGKVEAELERLASAVASGGEVRTLVDAIKKREQARDLLQAKVEHLDGLRKASESFDAGALDQRIREALADWRGLLDGHPEVARQVLRKLLTTPIYVVPVEAADGSRYILFGARGTYSRALKGIIGISAGVDSELWTFRERGVAPADDLTEEMRQLLKKKKAANSMDSSWSISVVPGEGVEPSRACAQRFLRVTLPTYYALLHIKSRP